MLNLETLIPRRAKRPLQRWRRALFEHCGSARYSRPSLNGLDRKLEQYLDFNNGFFIEAGANDGYQQSNTYYFEKMRGWRGILIEPIPELAAECRKNRRGPVVEAALVAQNCPDTVVPMHFAGLMSLLAAPSCDKIIPEEHVRAGIEIQNLRNSYTIHVPAKPLSSILDELGMRQEIDLLSLDVEGAEEGVLQGIDWARHAPRFICIEARHAANIEALLSPRYEQCAILSNHPRYRDILYQRKNKIL